MNWLKNKIKNWFDIARLVRRLLRHYGFVIVRRSTLTNWQGMVGNSPNGLGYRYALSDVIGQWPEQNSANTIPINSNTCECYSDAEVSKIRHELNIFTEKWSNELSKIQSDVKMYREQNDYLVMKTGALTYSNEELSQKIQSIIESDNDSLIIDQ